MKKYARVTVRYASGEVEHRYGTTVPKLGERIGRNGETGFVANVEMDGDSATVVVGTPAPEALSWRDVAGSSAEGSSSARDRILDAAYELFSRRGIRDVGTEEVLVTAGVARATLYRQFRTKDDLVRAFLQRREQRWSREFVEAEARRRGDTPREQLLAIFDVFDEWFHQDDFEGCSSHQRTARDGPRRSHWSGERRPSGVHPFRRCSVGRGG